MQLLLPNEVWCQIFGYLDDKNNAKLVCRLWYNLIINDTKHIIFDNVIKCGYSRDFEEFDWNYKRILNMLAARPKVSVLQFKSYMRCQYRGHGFVNFFKQAKSLSVDKIYLDGNLEHFYPSLPGWIIVRKLWIQDSLDIDETYIKSIVAFIPGGRQKQSDLSISQRFMDELCETLSKVKYLEEIIINFEDCDVPFTIISLVEFLQSLPLNYLTRVEFKHGQVSDMYEEEFINGAFPALKELFLPECELSFNNFEFEAIE